MAEKRDVRVYVREIAGLSIERQVEIANAAGVTRALYIEKRGQYPAMRDGDFFGSLRPGSIVGVARLPVLANNRKELTEFMARVKAAGYPLREIETGHEADGPGCGVMLLEALDYFASKVKHFGKRESAVEAGAKGGKEKARRQQAEEDAMPEEAARKIWHNWKRYRTEDDAVAAIDADQRYTTKLSSSTWRRRLGKRGGPVGRRKTPRE